MTYILLLIVLILLALLIFILVRKPQGQGVENELIALQAKLSYQEEELRSLKAEKLQLAEEQQSLSIQLAKADATIDQLVERLKEAEESKADLADLLEERFRGITSKIIDERAEQIRTRSEESLQPLREDLKRFGEQVEKAYKDEARERTSLQTEIRMLVEHSQKMSEEANSLTKALKGDNKVQGDWGEMILENILESSGLRKNEEYTLQSTLRDDAGGVLKHDETGKKMRPDAIIHYPNGRDVVIDSKVSLKAFSDYISAETEEERELAQKAHLQSVRRHIDELASKEYHAYLPDSADFVMLFIPNEPAYILAMKEAPNLWNEAYKKNVVLINGTNLLAALRMAKDLWVRDAQIKNVQDIFNKVGMLYDNCCAYLESFEKVEKDFKTAEKSLLEAKKKLYTGGQGKNIITRMERLRDMGAKSSKQISSRWLDADEQDID